MNKNKTPEKEFILIATIGTNKEGKKAITSIRFSHDRNFQNMMDQAWLRNVNNGKRK